MGGTPSIRVKVAAGVVFAVMLLVLLEVGLALLPLIGGDRLRRGLLYYPPEVTREKYEQYLADRDPIIGWPSPNKSVGGLPVPRMSPAFPAATDWCVTTYGESMTYGDEVSDDDAWGNVLAKRLGCAVGNFGIGGYGTDQALLRFTANTADHAPTTIVGIYVDNLLRNVNQYRYFLTGGETLALKPRFILENGKLTLVPIPNLSYEAFAEGLAEPSTIFPQDVLAPGSGHGPVIWSFPYTFSLIDLLTGDQVTNYVRGVPRWIDFYDRDHESGALPVTVAIIDEFRRRAASGKTVIVVLYPGAPSYELSRESGQSTFHTLTAELEAHGVPVRDLTADFSTYLGERSFCEVLVSPGTCSGHYNPEGNRVVAAAMDAFIASVGNRQVTEKQ